MPKPHIDAQSKRKAPVDMATLTRKFKVLVEMEIATNETYDPLKLEAFHRDIATQYNGTEYQVTNTHIVVEQVLPKPEFDPFAL